MIKYKSSITIFLSMVLVLIISLILSITELARMRASKLYLQLASNSAIDSMLSLYHNKLWDYYRLYGVEYKSNEMLKNEYKNYLLPYLYDENKNEYINNWYVGKYDDNNSFISVKSLLNDLNLENEIVEYMKFGTIGKIINIFNKNININDENNINEIVDDISDVNKKINENFVYNDIDKKYFNFKKEIIELEKAFNKICNNTKELNNIIANMNISISSNIQTAKNVVKKLIDIKNKLEIHSNNIMNYSELQNKLFNKIEINYNKYKNDLNNINNKFTEEIIIFIEEEFEKFFNEASDNSKNMVEIKKIENSIVRINTDFIDRKISILQNDIEIIEELNELLRDSDLSSEEKSEIRQELREAKEELQNDLRELKDEIQNVNVYVPDMSKLYKSSNEENILENILKITEDGLLRLVLSNDEINKIDNSNIIYNNYNVDSTNNIINKFFVNEYVLDFCNFYTKNMMNKKTPSQSNKLEVEYFISNKNNDKESLNDVIFRILLIRQALNMLYLMTSREKKMIARNFSKMLFGIFSPVVVEIMFVLILTAWGMAQSVSDVKKLLNNKRVKLIHDNESFDFDIEDLLTFGAESFTNNNNDDDKGISLNYEDYCRMLLYLTPSYDVISGLSNSIEINISSNENTFILNNVFYSISAYNTFNCNHLLTNMLFFKPTNVKLFDQYIVTINSYGDFLNLNE